MAFKADAAKIKRWREERHWSQEHLADLAGIGLRTIQRIENGENASQDSVMALAAAFNVDVMALSVDPEEEARLAAELKAKEGAATLRLTFYVHLASYLLSLVIFTGIALAAEDFEILKVMIWWTIGLAAHGITITMAMLVERHNREFGEG
ncbi:MAG: helix-turn-helix transcriptional regulator [Pseudomonadota bacterium]